MSNKFIVNRAFFNRELDGKPRFFVAIVAETKTKQEQDMINREIDDSLGFISFIISGAKTQEECRDFIESYCKGIRDDHDIDCYGITSKASCTISFGEDCWLAEEEMNYE